MKRVLIESPYGSRDPVVVLRNEFYVRACLADCFARGQAPFASHAIYTLPGVLRDNVPEERVLGIDAGLLWGSCAELTAVYTDLGITPGMIKGIKRAEKEKRPIEHRAIGFSWITDKVIHDVWVKSGEHCGACALGALCPAFTREKIIELCRLPM